MKFAVLIHEPYKDDEDIYAQFEPALFRELIVRYTLELGDAGKAFDRVEEDLRELLRH